MATLQEYCRHLGWNMAELERQTKLNFRTVKRAWDGEPVSAATAREIAQALTQALGRQIHVGDIEGLKVS